MDGDGSGVFADGGVEEDLGGCETGMWDRDLQVVGQGNLCGGEV